MTSPEEHGKRIHVTTSVLADNVPGYTDWSGKKGFGRACHRFAKMLILVENFGRDEDSVFGCRDDGDVIVGSD